MKKTMKNDTKSEMQNQMNDDIIVYRYNNMIYMALDKMPPDVLSGIEVQDGKLVGVDLAIISKKQYSRVTFGKPNDIPGARWRSGVALVKPLDLDSDLLKRAIQNADVKIIPEKLEHGQGAQASTTKISGLMKKANISAGGSTNSSAVDMCTIYKINELVYPALNRDLLAKIGISVGIDREGNLKNIYQAQIPSADIKPMTGEPDNRQCKWKSVPAAVLGLEMNLEKPKDGSQKNESESKGMNTSEDEDDVEFKRKRPTVFEEEDPPQHTPEEGSPRNSLNK